MQPTVTEAPRRGRPRPYPVTVTGLADHGSHLLLVSFGGDGLAGFRWPGPGSHLKVFLPEPGSHEVQLPPADADGFMVPPRPGEPRPVTRTYTPLRWDSATGQLDIEFLLHGDGPAAQWAARAELGDRLAVSQPRRTYEVLPDSEWLLLAGDESALPAIATLLAAVPPRLGVQVMVEIADPSYQIGLPATVQWVPRGERPAGTALAAAIAAWRPPSGPGQVWTACEAHAVRDIRADLLGRLPADRVLTRGYWRDGQANHPDHDYGDEELT